MLRRECFVVEGEVPLRRLVALADVPDHSILSQTIVGRPATIFRAGPEFAFQLLALWLLSWPVRWGWLHSLSGLGRWLLPLQRLTSSLGSDRSAMKIVVKGRLGDAFQLREWTLIAGKGDGPEIPTLAAQLLVRQLREGSLAVGARHAGGLLALSAFREEFAKLAIREQTVSRPVAPLYQRVIGERFLHLPAAVRRMHEVIGDGGAAGSAIVTRGPSAFARLIALMMRFPPAGEHPIHVEFTEANGTETWTRDFPGPVSERAQFCKRQTHRTLRPAALQLRPCTNSNRARDGNAAMVGVSRADAACACTSEPCSRMGRRR